MQSLLKRVEKQYFVDHKTLNALELGVPQFRERYFFIGIRKDRMDEKIINQSTFGQWFSFPENNCYVNAATKYKWSGAVPFGTLSTKPENLPIELCIDNCLIQDSELRMISNANEYFKLHVKQEQLELIQQGETNRPSFKRLHRFKYSPTACYGNNEVHLHPYKHRHLSVREILRIQGVPDSYIFASRIAIKYEIYDDWQLSSSCPGENCCFGSKGVFKE